MIVFAEVGSQIERIQGIPASVVLAIDKESFVRTQFSRSSKHGVIRPYILVLRKVRLYRPDSVLLLTIQIQPDLVQIKILKVERIFPVAVECCIIDQTDYDTRGQLTGKQFLVIDV